MRKISLWIAVIIVTILSGCVPANTEQPDPPANPGGQTTSVPSGNANLTNRSWKWVQTQMNDDSITRPSKADGFTITFTDDGKISGTTDCNNFAGTYTRQDNQLTFGPFMSTKMYCEGSQETVFLKQLSEVQSYLFVDNRLILEIKYDSGQLIFE